MSLEIARAPAPSVDPTRWCRPLPLGSSSAPRPTTFQPSTGNALAPFEASTPTLVPSFIAPRRGVTPSPGAPPAFSTARAAGLTIQN